MTVYNDIHNIDYRYKVILKMMYKHFKVCAYSERHTTIEACEHCCKLIPDMVNQLGTSPVFVVNTDDYIDSWGAIAIKLGKSDIISEELLLSLTNDLPKYIEHCKDIDKAQNKGLPFTQFILMPEDPIELPNKIIQEWELGYLWREVSPELWLEHSVTVNEKGTLNFYTRINPLNELTYLTIEYLLNKTTYVELSELNTKINIGYYNKNLPRNAKAKPVHIVYIGTKKDFIHKHPQYKNKILREPKLAHLVRGHWRKLHDGQKHGKDRHGYPIFNGYTWVIPHKRGKGDLPETTIYVTQ